MSGRRLGGAARSIGLIAAMVVLLLAFGSVIAMGLPIGTALVGLGVGARLITSLAAFVDISQHLRRRSPR